MEQKRSRGLLSKWLTAENKHRKMWDFQTGAGNWRAWAGKRSLFWELLSRWSLCVCAVWRPVVCVGFVSARAACHAQSAQMHRGVFNWEAVSEAQLHLLGSLQRANISLNIVFLVRIAWTLDKSPTCEVMQVQFWRHLGAVYVQLKVFLLVSYEVFTIQHTTSNLP